MRQSGALLQATEQLSPLLSARRLVIGM
jgi:hypothetical protein